MNILGANETAFMWWLALQNALEEEKGGTKKKTADMHFKRDVVFFAQVRFHCRARVGLRVSLVL